MKLTKIVCTIGPASESKEILRKLVKAGMNVARLNFSHGTYANHAKLIRNIRSVAKEMDQPIAILQDLQGPRIRIGEVVDTGIQIKKGDEIILVPQSEYKAGGTPVMLPNHYPPLSEEVKKGQHILIADGTMDLKVSRIKGKQIYCEVIVGGLVKSHKGINVPGATLLAPSMTKKDREDLAFGVSQHVDYVALSFVRTGKDIKTLRSLLTRLSDEHVAALHIGIIPKIERWEAVENFDEILKLSDGIMVARGDLGLEIPAEKVPIVQKMLIKKCIDAHKPVIVATQMLESMTTNNRPTRAEVSDVANAIIDHTDAVMLSGESAAGKYPVQAVTMMARIAHETERSHFDDYVCDRLSREKTEEEMIAHAVADIARTKKIRLVVVKDDDPELITLVASHRLEIRIIGFSKKPIHRHQLNLVRGVTMLSASSHPLDELIKRGLVRKGDLILEVEGDEIEIKKI
ncbi:MAG: pyruvate kinase [Candidatus Uhrbacteria bacterium]|nr:pyruvate kinase [Candidatus Uhrbacteria bacterium]